MEQLDQDIVNFAKATRLEESNNKPDIKGGSGEYGYYQYIPETWEAQSKKYGINVPVDKATPEQQNEVFYKWAKEKKDQGYNLGQISSMHNAGEGKPEAYQENWTGTNKYGVKYDTPGYAKRVAENYQRLKAETGGQVAHASDGGPVEPQKTLGEKVSNTIQDIFPGKKVGEAIGTLGGLVKTGADEILGNVPKGATKAYDTTAPTPLQVAGDVAQGALTVAPLKISPARSALGRILESTGIGAGIGFSSGLVKGKTDNTELLKDTAKGGAIGGILGVGGEAVKKIADYLPKRMLPFKTADPQYALSKKLGSPEKMLANSDEELKTMGKQLETILSKPEYKGIKVTGQDVYQRIAADLKDANLSPDELISEMTKLAKLKKGLIEKLFSPEGLDLVELQRLKSEIGGNTYKTVFDTPEIKSGKVIGNKVYHAMSDAITSIAKETEPIFENMSKEYLLNNSINRFINKTGGKVAITLNDLVAFDVGGLPTAIARRIIGNPTLNIKAAGLINKGGALADKVGRLAKPLITKGILGN